MPTRAPSADQSLARADRVIIGSAAPRGNDLVQWEAYAGAPSEGAARVRCSVPTSGFLHAWCGHLQAALDAACLIEPAAASVRDTLDDPPRPRCSSGYRPRDCSAAWLTIRRRRCRH